MEQVNLSLEEIYRNRVPKTFFIPLINGTWQPMYPPRYLEEGDIHYDDGQPIGSGYEQFVADIWVGVVLTLMVLSCLCCMCSCLLYQRFQEWRRKVFGAHPVQPNDHSIERESTVGTDVESLPSYTIVSGLPSYEEALEQLKQIRDLRSCSISKTAEAQESTPRICSSVEDNSQPPQLFSPLRPRYRTKTMGSTQLYSLAWGEFGSSLVSAVQLLRCHGDLVDVTLAAGGRSFPAHKIVLSAASPYLLDLLKNTPCKHPIVMLAGVAAHDLEALLEFVYRGEVSVDPNQLPSLLQAAHCLNIQGLAPAAVSSEKLDELGMGSTVHQNLTRDVINSFLPVRRRKRNRHKGMCSNRGGRGGGSGQGGGKWAREMNSQDGEDGIAGEGGSDGGGAAGSDDHDDVKVSEGQRTGTDGESSAAPNEEDSGKKSGVSDQPAVCPLCGATLRQSRNLRRHLELLHFGVSRGASSIRVKSRTVPQRHTEQRQDHEEPREGESGGEGSSPTPISLVSTTAPTHHTHALSMVVPANPMMVIDPQMCGRNGDHDPGDRSRICEPAPILGCVLGAPPIHHLAVQPPPPPTDLMMRRHQDDVAAMYPERRSPPSQGGPSHRVDVV